MASSDKNQKSMCEWQGLVSLGWPLPSLLCTSLTQWDLLTLRPINLSLSLFTSFRSHLFSLNHRYTFIQYSTFYSCLFSFLDWLKMRFWKSIIMEEVWQRWQNICNRMTQTSPSNLNESTNLNSISIKHVLKVACKVYRMCYECTTMHPNRKYNFKFILMSTIE